MLSNYGDNKCTENVKQKAEKQNVLDAVENEKKKHIVKHESN